MLYRGANKICCYWRPLIYKWLLCISAKREGLQGSEIKETRIGKGKDKAIKSRNLIKTGEVILLTNCC